MTHLYLQPLTKAWSDPGCMSRDIEGFASSLHNELELPGYIIVGLYNSTRTQFT
jgi:hypothetical protein